MIREYNLTDIEAVLELFANCLDKGAWLCGSWVLGVASG